MAQVRLAVFNHFLEWDHLLHQLQSRKVQIDHLPIELAPVVQTKAVFLNRNRHQPQRQFVLRLKMILQE